MLKLILKKIIRRISLYLYLLNNRERHVCYGTENGDKTFYIIGVDYETQGLFAIVKNVLIHIEYALNRGYLPIVDMQNFNSQFNKVGGNAWEFFFEQPAQWHLSEISHSRNIIYSRNITSWGKKSIYVSILEKNNRNRLEQYSHLFKKNIRLTEEMLVYINSKSSDILNKKNLLGVLSRGSDYTQKHPFGHPVQPTFEQLTNKIDEFLKIYQIDYIYVATEDIYNLERLINKYGEKILYIEQLRFGKLKKNYISDLGLNEDEILKLNMDYLSSLYILSKCKYFIAGRTAGTIGAALMSEGYTDYYYFDLGYYK